MTKITHVWIDEAENMTNNEISDEVLQGMIASFQSDAKDLIAHKNPRLRDFGYAFEFAATALRELQERRKADSAAPGDFVFRMCQEAEELRERAKKLSDFICENPKFKALDEKDKELMAAQVLCMRDYLTVLDERISRAKGLNK